MSVKSEQAISLAKKELNPSSSLRLKNGDEEMEFCEVFAVDATSGATFSLYHWIVNVDNNEIWVADSKLPFGVNIALIQRGAGVLLS